ncbi:MAG: NUDIX domain-containing protein [Rhodomicrobium sp.]
MAGNAKPSRVEIIKQERLLDAFFKVDKVTVSHEQFKGGMSAPRPYLVMDRGDAVAALLYDPERRKVITVSQFRIPTLGKGHGGGWIVEAVAGMIATNADGSFAETPLETLIREVQEETGYHIGEAKHLCTFFSSPGGNTERTFLFYAEVGEGDKQSDGCGLKAEGEDIAIAEFGVAEFFAKLDAREFEDAKLIMAGYWLMAQHARKESPDDAFAVSAT